MREPTREERIAIHNANIGDTVTFLGVKYIVRDVKELNAIGSLCSLQRYNPYPGEPPYILHYIMRNRKK